MNTFHGTYKWGGAPAPRSIVVRGSVYQFLRGNETLSAQCLENGRAQRSRNIVTRSDVGVRTNR